VWTADGRRRGVEPAKIVLLAELRRSGRQQRRPEGPSRRRVRGVSTQQNGELGFRVRVIRVYVRTQHHFRRRGMYGRRK